MLRIVHGASGSGKTMYLKKFAEKHGLYLHADTLYELLLQYAKTPGMLHPAAQLLTLDLDRFCFDDIDYQFAGRISTQELVFSTIKGLTDGGRDVAIGVLDEKSIIPFIDRINSEYKKEEVEWVEL